MNGYMLKQRAPVISKTVRQLWRWARILDFRPYFRTRCEAVSLWLSSDLLAGGHRPGSVWSPLPRTNIQVQYAAIQLK